MMTRWLLRLAVTGSALLLCAAIVFWVRSYRVRDEVEIYRRPYVAGEQPLLLLLWIRSAAGGIRVDAYQSDEPLFAEEVKANEIRIAEQTDRSRWKSFREPAPVYTALMPREEWTYSGAAGFEWGLRATSNWLYDETYQHYTAYGIVAPYWSVVVLFGSLPGLWLLRTLVPAWRKRRRLKKGVCATCGYDVRASAGRCPECGVAIAGQTGGVTIQGTSE